MLKRCKEWLKDNSGLVLLLVLLAGSALDFGRIVLADSITDQIAVREVRRRGEAGSQGERIVIRRGEKAWYVYVGTRLTFVVAYAGLVLAGFLGRFSGKGVLIMIVTIVLQIASYVFLGGIAAMLQ